MQHPHSPEAALEPIWPMEEQEPFRALFEEAPIPYHELDAEGIIRRVNRAQCELLGYSAEDLIGKPIWAFTLHEEQDASRKAVARRLSESEPLVSGRRTYVTRDLRLVTAEVHSRLILGQDGKPVGIRAALIDITER